MQAPIIDRICHYRALQLVARGGMANVYLAQDIHTGKLVAMKLVHRNAVEYHERFRFEMETLARLSHRHILPVLDYGEDHSWYYLITPYIAGGTLNQRLKKGPLSCEHAGELLDQLAQALQFAHDQRLVHRDIKASNILLKNEHFVYLADFGLVEHMDETADVIRRDSLWGTPEYIAPELAERNATPLSDLYSLGILLYRMVTGQFPFTGNNAIHICIKHIRDVPPLPSLLNETLSEGVEDVILRALEKDPQKRFQTVQEFSQAYRQALQVDRYAQMMAATQIRIPVIKVSQAHKQQIQWSLLSRPRLATALLGLLLLACIPAMTTFPASSPVEGSPPVRVGHHSQVPHTGGTILASVASTSTGSSLKPTDLQKDKRQRDGATNSNGSQRQAHGHSKHNPSSSKQSNTSRQTRDAEIPANDNKDHRGNNRSTTNQSPIISVPISTQNNENDSSTTSSSTHQKIVVLDSRNVTISPENKKAASSNSFSHKNGKVHNQKK